MSLSNTATPRYYGEFRDAVIRGDIPVNQEISMEMNRIDELIARPDIYYDDKAVEGWVAFCESEMTLTDGSDLRLLDTFKLWGEEIFGWYYFVTRSVYQPNEDGHGGHYVNKRIKKRLTTKQFLIVARGAAKSMYAACLQAFFLVCDTSTTVQLSVAPTIPQTEEILKKELTEKYFKIKECLSRSGNFISELSNKKDVENLLYYFLNNNNNNK